MTDNRTILITGSSKGIGKDIVEYYVKKGCNVIGCSRGDINFKKDNYRHFKVDVSDEKLVKSMFSQIRKEYGRLDILINNAGIASMNYVLLTSLKEVQDIINTNFIGSFLCSREAVKLMKKNNYGRIINISSIHVPLASTGSSLYGSSKAAISHFSKVLAKEVYKFGITINILGLSVVNNSGMEAGLSQEIIDTLLEETISKKRLDFKDVSNAIEFFTSNESTMVTNQTIYLGGI